MTQQTPAKPSKIPLRTRADIAVGGQVAVGDRLLRCEDETVWRVRQVHRRDCRAELERDGQIVGVWFSELRLGWKRIVSWRPK